MSKKYFIKMAGYFYEVTKDEHDAFKKEQRRHNYLEETKKNVVILSYDAIDKDDMIGESMLIDTTVNVEEEAIKNVMIDKLREGLNTLTDDELYIIENLIYQEKSERELAKKLNISQNSVHKRKIKVLDKLKKFLEK